MILKHMGGIDEYMQVSQDYMRIKVVMHYTNQRRESESRMCQRTEFNHRTE